MFFGGDTKEKLEYLEEERKKLWQKLTELEKEIGKNANEYEKEAKEASRKTSEFRNKAATTKEQAEGIFNEIKEILTNINDVRENALTLCSETEKIRKESEEEHQKITNIATLLEESLSTAERRVSKIEGFFSEHPNLEDEIDNIAALLSKAEDNLSKANTAYKNINTRKTEIDDIYYEVYGYTEKNEETGEETIVEGLKAKLEKQYQKLDASITQSQNQINTLELSTKSKLDLLLSEKTNEVNGKVEGWNKEYQSLKQKIEDLLPNALTAGLSSAYSAKKKDEEAMHTQLKKQFYYGIAGLIIVSLIPLSFSLYSIYIGQDLYSVINRIPKISAAILPLYLPVLWLTFYANKQLNLSKRLIEEYTHKEVLSKTFEGLSNQIGSLEESSISNELKVRLLYNLLQVSSENPGKLISNYKSSDHPLMEVLDQTSRLQNSIETLEKIPGMGRIVKYLDDKKLRVLEKTDKEVNKILDNTVDKAGIVEKVTEIVTNVTK